MTASARWEPIMVIEVDGDAYHVETPADADQRTLICKHEGPSSSRPKRVSECDTRRKSRDA
jgi:hypothetical protein